MTIEQALLLLSASVLAGALNSVAGGGSFISFPMLIFIGIPSINANATNTAALWPGSIASAFAYREELKTEIQTLLAYSVVSIIGGLLGAILLLYTPNKVFDYILPYLLLVATMLFALGKPITKVLQKNRQSKVAKKEYIGSIVAQLLIAIYGGFFGGGIGILMLAVLSVMGMENIHKMNAVKTLLATWINGIAVATFVFARAIVWPQAILMIAGAIVGGYLGATYARRLNPSLVRNFVTFTGFAMAIYFFLK
ncbi:MAG: sulfite exporter TauE/SafE family protein [Blastocatellia bacterium]|nr:sulfite exporter TauE/SafE family protein [Blastocatellia bacterium]